MPFSDRSRRTIGESTCAPAPSPSAVATAPAGRGGAARRRRRPVDGGGAAGAGGGDGGVRCRWRLRGWRGASGRRGGASLDPLATRAVADHREPHADLDRLALGHEDLGEDAGRGRGHLGVDLVRRDLEERLVALDRRRRPPSSSG